LIAGNCDYYSCVDIIRLIFEDGGAQEIEVSFSDHFGDSKYGDTVIWTGGRSMKVGGEIVLKNNRDHIFARGYKIENSNINLKSISLPLSPSAHIFAITLVS